MLMTQIKPLVLQPNWQVPDNIKAIVTTCVDDFNLAMHVGDDKQHVLSNRTKLAQITNTDKIGWLNQTHSCDVVYWDNTPYTLIDADASITTKTGMVCIVMTADCLPIILTNKTGDFVAAIHAGWRGLNNGIIQNTVQKLAQFAPQDMISFIGPAINQECFEVGSEVRENFINKNIHDDKFFIPSINQNKYMADLRGIAEKRLVEIGLFRQNIYNSPICTKCLNNWFFSYRANPKTGRIATLVWKI